jgi:hypothetical protein
MKRPTTILDALSDPRLLGGSFKRRWLKKDTWAPWRSFLCAAFGLPFENEAAFRLFRECTQRKTAPTKQFSEIYLIAGRRSGKSYLTALIGTYIAAFRDVSEFLAPGETPVVAICAQDRQAAQVVLRYIRGFIASSPILRSMLVSDLKEVITLSNNVEIQVLTSDYKSIRGRTLCAAIVDEMAFLNSSDGSASSDAELLAAIKPGLLSIPGSMLIGLSSPFARRGELFRQFETHYGKDSSETLVWVAPSLVMNPSLNAKAIEQALERDPISAKTEYLAAWREDSDGFLTEEQLDAVTIRGRSSLPRLPNTSHTSFVDMSGGKSDSATLAICHLENDRAILDCLVERGAPHSPEQVAAEFCSILKSFGLHSTCGDKYAGSWVSDAFNKNGVVYSASEKNRSEIYLTFLPSVLSGQVELLDNQKMRSQFLGLQRRPARNQDIIDHSAGAHDDIANACAGALTLCLEGVGSFPVLEMVSSGRWERLRDTLAAATAFITTTDKFGKSTVEVNPRNQNLNKQASFETERRLRGIEPSAMNPQTAAVWAPKKCPPCPRCNSTCVVPLGNKFHCNQCGYDSDNPELPQESMFMGRDGRAVMRRPQ